MATVKTEGLVELMQLVDYMAPKFEKRRVPGPPELRIITTPTTPAVKDFGKVFQRHWDKYIKDYPGASTDQYRRHAVDWLTDKIEAVKKHAPTARQSDPVQWAEIYINDYLKAAPTDYGIVSILKADQLALLYEKMQPKYVNCRQSDFVSALSGEPLPLNFKRVKWLDNKTALWAFLHVIKGGQTVKVEDASLFSDKQGRQSMKLNKPKNDNSHKQYIQKFQRLISNQ